MCVCAHSFFRFFSISNLQIDLFAFSICTWKHAHESLIVACKMSVMDFSHTTIYIRIGYALFENQI